MDRLEAMSLLIAVADEGNLSAAARRLGKPLSTVHRKIGELERHLDSRLLHRTTRQVSLTQAGATYVAACRRILEDVGEAERAVKGEYAEPRGELVVTAPIVFGRLHVVPGVAGFLSNYPEIDVRLLLADRIAHLMEEHIDVALRIGALADSSQVATRVGVVRRVLCASPAYLERQGTPAHPADLLGHDCIAIAGPGESYSWDFMQAGRAFNQSIRPRLTVTTAESAIEAASRDVGITQVLSYQVDDAVAASRLQIVLPDFEPTAWPVNLVHAGQMPLPLKLRVFLDVLKPWLRQRMARLAL